MLRAERTIADAVLAGPIPLPDVAAGFALKGWPTHMRRGRYWSGRSSWGRRRVCTSGGSDADTTTPVTTAPTPCR